MAVDIDPTGQRLAIRGPDGAALPVRPEQRDPTLIRITSGAAQATILPGVGFNVVDWRVATPGGERALLHQAPDVLAGGSGTRSGNPILFPFPNRIARGRYRWAGQEYRLALADGGAHAIHGFAPKAAWRQFAPTGPSAVTGEFRLRRDAPEPALGWPGDLRLRMTISLTGTALRLHAEVTNVDSGPVPFGLGYHPYFTPLGAQVVDEIQVQAFAARQWVLDDMIPTGVTLPVDERTDLRTCGPIGSRSFDDVLTALAPQPPDASGLVPRARLTGPAATLTVATDTGFRDLVVYTPEDRRSIALEPYTCPTDAVHLDAAGLDVGWRVLAPGGSWTGVVEYQVSPNEEA